MIRHQRAPLLSRQTCLTWPPEAPSKTANRFGSFPNFSISTSAALVCDRKLLATIHTLRATSHLVGHQPVMAITDHASIDTFLATSYLHDVHGRFRRWLSELSRYSLTILYVKGEQNVIADFLSRPPGQPQLTSLL